MKLGISLITLTFITTILSAIYYYLSERDEKNLLGKKRKKENHILNKKKYARLLFYFSITFISAASIYLYYLIFTHQFQVEYIYQYSSRDLPFGFLLSTFWAGQEGSFLFWTLCISWLGLIFIKTSAKYENYGMLFLNLVQSFFLIVLIKASPFNIIEGHQIPADGAGLNPLLQNFWMVIHPPILFIGYAAATFPFVIALASMVKNDSKEWVVQAFPWVLGVSITLGAGIVIGAFWSYETLGWGGYWGWDPVENSSLIPWLTTIALFHGLIIEKRSGALIKTNIFLAIMTFILVLYATFLTRSGVLADFSVHSFQDLGINGLLIIFQLVVVVSGFGLLFSRYSKLNGAMIDFSTLNRENILFFGLVILGASSLLTILGTSSPIITGWFGEPSQVDISFYNNVNLPVGIAMALVIGLAPLLRWQETQFIDSIKKSIPSIVITITALTVSIYFGVHKPVEIIFLGLSLFTIFSNIFNLVDRFKLGWQRIGAPLAHLGIGLMFIGIIISGSFAQTERVLLSQGEEKLVFDQQLTFLDTNTPPDGKNVIEIKVKNDMDEYIAKPRLYYNKTTRGNMREPYIKYGAITDFYIAPLELREEKFANNGSSLILHKEETKTFAGMKIHFHAFEMLPNKETGEFGVGANLKIEFNNQIFDVTPIRIIGKEKESSKPKYITGHDGNKVGIKLAAIDADNKSIKIEFEGLPDLDNEKNAAGSQLLIEVSKKPFMNILWLGTIIFTIATIIAIKKRISED